MRSAPQGAAVEIPESSDRDVPHGNNVDLILWCHADAEPGMRDKERRLTAKGRKQAQPGADEADGKAALRAAISPDFL